MKNNTTTLLTLIICIAFTSMVTADEPIKLPAKKNFHLYLLIGQSNMSGRGKMTEEDKQPVDGILMLNRKNKWQAARHPLHYDSKGAGVGLGLSFAKEMAKQNKDVTIGLVPCAVGGTALNRWVEGHNLYKAALSRAKVAMKDGQFKGIIWHQGESDHRSNDDANSYGERLKGAIASWRKDLNQPNIPFVAGEISHQFVFISPTKKRENAYKINQALLQLPENVKRTGCASAKDLETKKDKVHFVADALKTYGKRYAKIMIDLQSTK